MATSPSPYPTEPKSLVLNQFEQKWLRLRMQDAVARSWAEACSISERLFSDPSPPDDLWERAVQRTASALREGDGTSLKPEVIDRRVQELLFTDMAPRALTEWTALKRGMRS